jgi:hypothetical protein
VFSLGLQDRKKIVILEQSRALKSRVFPHYPIACHFSAISCPSSLYTAIERLSFVQVEQGFFQPFEARWWKSFFLDIILVVHQS